MKVIRDLENWERTGLYRLAIRDRDCRHPVWDAGWIGRSKRRLRWAGAAATGGFCWGKEKATARLDCATFSISGWCFADWFVGSCFSVAERCRQASPLSRKFTGSDAAQWLSL